MINERFTSRMVIRRTECLQTIHSDERYLFNITDTSLAERKENGFKNPKFKRLRPA